MIRTSTKDPTVTKNDTHPTPGAATQRLVDLREILRYVPQYRDKVFVIAFDSAIAEHDNFRNLLLDLALLRSLRIGVTLMHEAGHPIDKLALHADVTPPNTDANGATHRA